MHTDEYGISLSRELNVCRSAVRKTAKVLSQLESKYNQSTEDFVASGDGNRRVDKQDALLWHQSYEARRVWQDKLKQYEELLTRMET